MTEIVFTLAAIAALVGIGLWAVQKITAAIRGYINRVRRY